MGKQITILLADDHRVLRQGMAQALETQPDMKVVAQADNGLEAVDMATIHQPDVALIDINMPQMDGVEATSQLRIVSPKTRIIILTMYSHGDYIIEAIKAGAHGYLLKEVELEEVFAAVRTVAGGEAIVDSAITGQVLAKLREPRSTETGSATEKLSKRDIEILRLLAEGKTNQEIATAIFIAEKTVRNRLTVIYRTLNLENRTQAALYAIREGLVDPNQ